MEEKGKKFFYQKEGKIKLKILKNKTAIKFKYDGILQALLMMQFSVVLEFHLHSESCSVFSSSC